MRKTMSIEELKQFFKDKDVVLDNLAVLTVGADTIIGEISEDGEEATHSTVLVTNPKRLYKMSQVQAGGLVINYMVGDWDFIEEGSLWMAPTICYHVMEQPEVTISAVLSLLKEHFDRKVMHKAEQAGIVIPATSIESPFRKKENGG